MAGKKNSGNVEAEVIVNNSNTKEEEVIMAKEINNVVVESTNNTNPNTNGGIAMETSYDEKVLAMAKDLGMDPEQVVNDMEVIDASNKRGGGRTGGGSGRWASTRDFTIRFLKISGAMGRRKVSFGDVVRACILPQAGIWAAWKYNGKIVSAAEVKAQGIPNNQLKVVSDIMDKQMRYRQCMNYIRNNFLSLEGEKGFKTGSAKGGLPQGWDVHYVEGGKGDNALSFVFKG